MGKAKVEEKGRRGNTGEGRKGGGGESLNHRCEILQTPAVQGDSVKIATKYLLP